MSLAIDQTIEGKYLEESQRKAILESGKNILVTGSSGGIGRAICIAFSELNARVHLHYNSNKEEAEKTIQLLHREDHELYQADLSNPQEAKSMIDNINDSSIVFFQTFFEILS